MSVFLSLAARTWLITLHGLLDRHTVPSMIKAHFSWVWQCTTLNRGDELANLLLSCIQPHQLAIPDFRTCKGQNFGRCRSVFGVLSMYHETKIPKPGVRSVQPPPHPFHDLLTTFPEK